MPNIVLKSVGEGQEFAVANFLAELTEQNSFELVNSVRDAAVGDKYTIYDVPEDEVDEVITALKNLDSYAVVSEDGEDPIIFEDDSVDGPFCPIVPADEVSQAGREASMAILVEAAKIAQRLENYDLEEASLKQNVEAAKKKAESLRTEMSGKASGIYALVVIVATLGSIILFTSLIAAIIAFIASSVIMDFAVKEKDLAKHKDENDAKADAYILEHVDPLQAKLDEVTALKNCQFNFDWREWAIDVVGEKMFYSPCILDLYDLIKSRRADTIKEALNKYDDEQYKARMAEMQQATQRAAETTAEEAIKQTAQLGEIARNTDRAARAAQKTAKAAKQTARATKVNTLINYGTYRNTKKDK